MTINVAGKYYKVPQMHEKNGFFVFEMKINALYPNTKIFFWLITFGLIVATQKCKKYFDIYLHTVMVIGQINWTLSNCTKWNIAPFGMIQTFFERKNCLLSNGAKTIAVPLTDKET